MVRLQGPIASKRLPRSAGSRAKQKGYFLSVKQQPCTKPFSNTSGKQGVSHTKLPTLWSGVSQECCSIGKGAAHRGIFAGSQVRLRNSGRHLTFCKPQQHRQETGTRLVFHSELISLNKTPSSKGSQPDKVNLKCVFIYMCVHTSMPGQRIPPLQKQTRKYWYQSSQDC